MAVRMAVDRTKTSFQGTWELHDDEAAVVHQHLQWGTHACDPLQIMMDRHPHPGQRLQMAEMKVLLDLGWNPDFTRHAA